MPTLAGKAARILLLLALFGPGQVQAEPVPEAERIPVDLRRTTLVVRDLEASLAFYRDTLGMQPIYDQVIGGKQGNEASRPTGVRLVLLRANDRFIGVLGLMQRLELDPDALPPPRFERAMPGDPILVFHARDLEQRWPAIAALPQVKVHTAPTRVEYPGPGGTTIPVLFSAVHDPDGFFVEINRLLDPPTGRED